MAILLIHKGSHWMSKLSVGDVTARVEKDPTFRRRYDARYSFGDIVEVREDGAIITNNERVKFTIVTVTNKSKNELDYLQQSDAKNKVRRYRLNASLLPTFERDQFNAGDVKLNTSKFTTIIVDKKNG